jgi:hypothetical protein
VLTSAPTERRQSIATHLLSGRGALINAGTQWKGCTDFSDIVFPSFPRSDVGSRCREVR